MGPPDPEKRKRATGGTPGALPNQSSNRTIDSTEDQDRQRAAARVKFIIGVDPGLDGAIAALGPGNHLVVHSCPTFDPKRGKRDIDVASLCAIFREFDPAITRVYIERAQAMPGQGGSSIFNYGAGWGIYRGIIAMAGLPLEMVAPAAWKKALRIGPDKAEALRRASMLMPLHHHLWTPKRLVMDKQQAIGRAEASLICWWAADRLSGGAR